MLRKLEQSYLYQCMVSDGIYSFDNFAVYEYQQGSWELLPAAQCLASSGNCHSLAD